MDSQGYVMAILIVGCVVVAGLLVGLGYAGTVLIKLISRRRRP